MIPARIAGCVVVFAFFGALACEAEELPPPPPPWDPRAWRGLEISPVFIDLEGKPPPLVALGSYIVNAQAACNDCHTCPSFADGHDPFKGQYGVVNPINYLGGGRKFGEVIAPDITPDENGLPAGLTLEEFVSIMRTGRDPENPNSILQGMPWPVYAKMTDHDLHAIYEYLRSIPSGTPGSCG